MPPHRHVVPVLVAIGLALAVAPALAGNPQPSSPSAPSGPPVEIPIRSADGITTVCNPGVVGPVEVPEAYLAPPDDAYYMLIEPGTCGSCPTASRQLTTAHIVLKFDAPCVVPVSVSIVEAEDLGNGCLAPKADAVLCAPVQHEISDNVIVTGQCQEYELPVNVACCVEGSAFLRIEFDGGCGNGRPMFCGPTSCTPCTQYNRYPGSLGFEDVCSVFSNELKAIAMYVDSTCCLATSTAPGSWGRLKTLYR